MGHRQRHFLDYDDKMQVFAERMSVAGNDSREDEADRDVAAATPEHQVEKDNDDDDDEEETGQGFRRGTKRKLEEKTQEEKAPEKAYTELRRSVFGVLMCKLNRYRQVADPSLRRSVLICNTLRCIEREMADEGLELDLVAQVPFLPPIQTDNVALDPLPPTTTTDCFTTSNYTAMLPLVECAEYSRKSGHAGEQRATAVACLDEDDDDDELEHDFQEEEDDDEEMRMEEDEEEEDDDEEEEESPGSISWSSVLNFSSQGDVDVLGSNNGSRHFLLESSPWTHGGSYGGGGGDPNCVAAAAATVASSKKEAEQQQMESENGAGSGGPNTSPSASSDSGISTASDEIFGDIDLSLYDFDLLPLSPPNSRGVPPTVEELYRSFPGYQQRQQPQQTVVSSCVRHLHLVLQQQSEDVSRSLTDDVLPI